MPSLALVVGLLAAAGPRAAPLAQHSFRFDRPAEAVLTLDASCAGCDWGASGREAAVLVVALDGAYSQHVVLFRGPTGSYRLLLGPLAAGTHRVALSRDEKRSAPRSGAATVDRVDVEAVAPGDPAYEAVAGAPILHARRGSVEGFTDVPLLLYTEALGGSGARRYTYVFSNEDGGTPPDRLMATWGRVTDIEEALTRTVDGDRVRETIQAKDHVVRPFAGERLGVHPVLHVATRNNMFDDRGKRTVRLAPAPEEADLRGASREAVMDRHPWTYDVSAREVRREGRVDAGARPKRKRIPDPSRFVGVEACGTVDGARLAVDLELRDGAVVASDAGRPELRIARSGCFRAAVALPPGSGLDAVRAVRLRAHKAPTTKERGEARPPLVRIDAVNRVFGLADPATSRAPRWPGPSTLELDGRPLVVPVP